MRLHLTVTTDCVTGFPTTSDNHNAIAVFVDALTKYTVIVPCTKENSGADWANMLKGYNWKLTTAHAPWSDGQTERANRLIEDVLRHFVSADMLDWDKHLSSVQFAINNAWQETVQETPMSLNHGRHPKYL